jgi:TonB family protein
MTETWKQWQGLVVDGKFQLQRYLGGSDRSAVFLTEWGDAKVQQAAIKLIPADPENAALHLSQWALATKLSHPHLLRLFRAGRCELDGLKLLYVVTEYAEEDLSQILPQRPLTATESHEMISAVIEALAYLHSQGLVHGHLKPANIMAAGNALKISSDGICAIAQTGGDAGKASLYDPSEAAIGTRSPSADVWSLGMILVEALTQHLPTGNRAEDGELALPETLPAPFLNAARHCLCPDPQHRWTVADIHAHLSFPQQTERAEAPDQPTQRFAPEAAAVRTPGKFDKPYVRVALAVVLLLATAVAVLTMPNRRPPSQQQRDAASKPPGTQEQPRQASAVPENRELTAGKSPVPVPTRPEVVSGAPGAFVCGTVIQRVLPRVPRRARRTIRGKVNVRVKVAVDSSGSVARATLDPPGSSDYFANLAMEAARRWRFTPARVNGQKVASEWILGFEFGRARTKIRPIALLDADQHL